jgi:hypothetical protein
MLQKMKENSLKAVFKASGEPNQHNQRSTVCRSGTQTICISLVSEVIPGNMQLRTTTKYTVTHSSDEATGRLCLKEQNGEYAKAFSACSQACENGY